MTPTNKPQIPQSLKSGPRRAASAREEGSRDMQDGAIMIQANNSRPEVKCLILNRKTSVFERAHWEVGWGVGCGPLWTCEIETRII